MKFHVIVERKGGVWFAFCREFIATISTGRSKKEAIELIIPKIRLQAEFMYKFGTPIYQIDEICVEEVEVNEVSRTET